MTLLPDSAKHRIGRRAEAQYYRVIHDAEKLRHEMRSCSTDMKNSTQLARDR